MPPLVVVDEYRVQHVQKDRDVVLDTIETEDGIVRERTSVGVFQMGEEVPYCRKMFRSTES